MTVDRGYLFGNVATELESRRLALLEECYDPGTRGRLDRLGVRPGARCLELGAGRGSITRWLADRVGPTGRVVAADLDHRLLGEVPGNVEVRTFDVRHDELESESYDVVHCRSVLMHLPDPAAALRTMARSLGPGGVLLVEEPDYGLFAYGGRPDAQMFTIVTHKVLGALTSAGVQNSYLGRTLPGLVADSGLEQIDSDVEVTVARPGDPAFEFHQATVEVAGPASRAAVLITDDDRQRLLEVGRDPATTMTSVALVAVAARRAMA